MDTGKILGVIGVGLGIGGGVYLWAKTRTPKIEEQLASIFQYTAGLGYCDSVDPFDQSGGEQLPAIWGYSVDEGKWLLYSKCIGLKELKGLTTGLGYWLWVSQNCVLSHGGFDYSLTTGWNLIGWQG